MLRLPYLAAASFTVILVGSMYQYQEHPQFFAQIAGGLEEEGAGELRDLGAANVRTTHRGLYFEASPAVLYGICYAARLPSRVLAPLVTFDCHSDRYLYRVASGIDWSDFLSVDQTLAVFANVSNSRITHSKYAALRLKDAIVDQFREATGRRPSVDTRSPDIWLALYIAGNRAVISIEASGAAMHRRGYRTATVEAPMQETVAAAVIRMAGWDGERPLYDPMCGSGTLLAEALSHYGRIPSGYLRSGFGFQHLPGYDAAVWEQTRARFDGQIRPLPDGLIGGSDVSADALDAARQNLANLPSGASVRLEQNDFRDLPPLADRIIVCNPPYGLRLGRDQDMHQFYRAFGDFLKHRCTGSTAYVYFGKREFLKDIGLRPAWKRPLVSGALDGRLARFDMY